MRTVDDNENSVFKHQKPVVFKYRVLIVIYYSHLFLYIKFSLRVVNNLLLYIYIYINFANNKIAIFDKEVPLKIIT